MAREPTTVAQATFPPNYRERGGEADQPLAWEGVERRLREAPNYWLATVSSEGRPHVRPVDGVWVEGALCFGGSPETRWARNLQERPLLTVHLGSGEEVVILEGTAEHVTDPEHPLAVASTAASRAKYPQYFSGDKPLTFSPFWALHPAVAFAWSLESFPRRATRWTFER
jgi:hypothetical protein